MTRAILFRSAIALAGVAVAIACGGAQAAPGASAADDGHRHDTVTILCNTQYGHSCYFNILRAKGGVLPVKLDAQQKVDTPDLEVGKDFFTVMVDRPPPSNISVCRAEASDSPPCRWGVLQKAINDSGNR